MRETFDADIVDGEPGDFGDLAVAEAFEQERDDQPVLVRQHGDGAAQGGQALAVFQVLMGAAEETRRRGKRRAVTESGVRRQEPVDTSTRRPPRRR